jgi:hypothetical protein
VPCSGADNPELVRRYMELHRERLQEQLVDRLRALAGLERFLLHAILSCQARQDDLQLLDRSEPHNAVVREHRSEGGGDRLAVSNVKVGPQSARPGDEREVGGMAGENRIRRVRRAPLNDRVEERRPLQTERLGAARDLRDRQSFLGELEQHPGPVVLRAQEFPDVETTADAAQFLGDVRRVDTLALVPDADRETCGSSTVQATIARVSRLRAATSAATQLRPVRDISLDRGAVPNA